MLLNPMIASENMDWIDLDTSPVNEEGAQVGQPDALRKMRDEARRTEALLCQKLGEPPTGVTFRVYRNEHDFGPYLSLRVYYDATLADAMAYALACEGEFPETWDDTATVSWRRYRPSTNDNRSENVGDINDANGNLPVLSDERAEVITTDAHNESRGSVAMHHVSL